MNPKWRVPAMSSADRLDAIKACADPAALDSLGSVALATAGAVVDKIDGRWWLAISEPRRRELIVAGRGDVADIGVLGERDDGSTVVFVLLDYAHAERMYSASGWAKN